MGYFIRIRGKIFGPLDEIQLINMSSTRKIGRTTEVSEDGINWRSAETLAFLFPAPPPPASSRPSPDSPFTNPMPPMVPVSAAPLKRRPSWIVAVILLILCAGVAGKIIYDRKIASEKSEQANVPEVADRQVELLHTDAMRRQNRGTRRQEDVTPIHPNQSQSTFVSAEEEKQRIAEEKQKA